MVAIAYLTCVIFAVTGLVTVVLRPRPAPAPASPTDVAAAEVRVILAAAGRLADHLGVAV